MSSYEAPSLQTLLDIPSVAYPDSRAVLSLKRDGAPPSILTHSTLRGCINYFRSRIQQLAIPQGCLVSIAMPNSAAFIVAFLGLTARGCVAAPLNPGYTEEEFVFYFDDAKASALIVLKGSGELARKAAKTLGMRILEIQEKENVFEVEVVDGSSDGALPDTSISRIRPTDRALFLHTSGTTSRPKGVPLTHANLVTSVANIASTYELTETDCCLLVMPLFHVHGLMAATLTTLATGGCVAIPAGGKFSASGFWPAVQQVQATWYTAVPTIHQILLMRAKEDYSKDSPPKLKFIRSCSASLAPAVLSSLEHTFHAPVLEAYAMTEASHQITSNPLPKYGPRKPGSVGPGQNVKVACLDQKNEPVPTGETGEVCIQGDNVTSGYLNGPNEEAFAGGWFHTGDQGFLDTNGYLTLTGRIKELVNRGGEKISPVEVDAALLAHPAVGEAVSFAVPDEKYGEEVNAAVVLKPGATVTAEDLTAFVSAKLASFKIPKRFFITEDLPRTATGKIQRRVVARHFVSESPN